MKDRLTANEVIGRTMAEMGGKSDLWDNERGNKGDISSGTYDGYNSEADHIMSRLDDWGYRVVDVTHQTLFMTLKGDYWLPTDNSDEILVKKAAKVLDAIPTIANFAIHSSVLENYASKLKEHNIIIDCKWSSENRD